MLVMLKMSVPPLLFLCRWIMWHQNIVWTSYRSLKCQKKTRSKMFLGLKVEVLFSEWVFSCHAAVSGSALMVFCEAFAVPWISSGSVGAFCESGGRCEWVWWGSSSQPSITAMLSSGAGCPRPGDLLLTLTNCPVLCSLSTACSQWGNDSKVFILPGSGDLGSCTTHSSMLLWNKVQIVALSLGFNTWFPLLVKALVNCMFIQNPIYYPISLRAEIKQIKSHVVFLCPEGSFCGAA